MYMFTNLQGDLNTGLPLVGNPDMEPEKTIAYEFGLHHAFSSDLALKVTTYYKDVSNLTSTRMIRYPGGSYTYYTNADYGSVKGFDVVLTKHRSNSLIAGSVNYSYMIAQGNASSRMRVIMIITPRKIRRPGRIVNIHCHSINAIHSM